MDSNGQTSSGDRFDAKGVFRRLSTDATNRKYRRRSPGGGSASTDGSPVRSRSRSPIPTRKNPEKTADDRRRRDDERASGGDWRQKGQSGESRRHSDKQSSRSSHRHMEHDDYARPGKNEDNDDRDYSKSSSHSLRDSRGKHFSDHSRRDNDHRSRDYPHHVDKDYRDKYDVSAHRSRDKERDISYPENQKCKNKDSLSDRFESGRKHTTRERDRYKEYKESQDEKRDRGRDFGDRKSFRSHAYEESRECLNEFISTDAMESGLEKYIKEDNEECDAGNKFKEQCYRGTREIFEDEKFSSSIGQEFTAKRSKFYTIDGETTCEIDVLKPTTFADEKQSSSSKHGEVTLEQGVKDSDIDAAKVAAMKAAELVNRNLIGTGYMTADQKKKLLWGNKKSTNNSEESAHRWDTSMFGDCERQEKFNKLMGVKGNMKMEHKPGIQDAEKQKELQMDLEKQYTAGLRRRDGRTVGLGL